MSIKHILAAMEAKVGSSARKLVLIKLADNANDLGECYPSYLNIAAHCEMSKRSIINHVAVLESDGFLTKEIRTVGINNTSNLYRLTIEKGGADSAPPSADSALPPSANSAPPSADSALPPSANSAPLTCHSLNLSLNQEINVTNEFETNPEIVADELAKKILMENPAAVIKPNGWLGDIDKAIRIDGRSIEDLLAIIAWIYCGQGGFWKSNILSGKKLREKFDQLFIQMNERGRGNGAGGKFSQGESTSEKNRRISRETSAQFRETIAS